MLSYAPSAAAVWQCQRLRTVGESMSVCYIEILKLFFSGLAILGILELEAVMILSIGILHIIYYIFRCAMHTMSLRRSLPR